MKRPSLSRGFTLIEILVVIAILATLAAVTLLAFRNVYRDSARRTAIVEIADAFRDSRNNTLGAVNDTVYGVRVGTSSVTRFTGNTYTLGAVTNEVYEYEGGVTATGTLVTNGIAVVFARLTGIPSATGTILVRDIDQAGSTSVRIQSTGLIEY